MKNNLINKSMLNPVGVYDSNYEFDRLIAVNLDIYLFIELNVFISSFIF
jgi:hypothetical protein